MRPRLRTALRRGREARHAVRIRGAHGVTALGQALGLGAFLRLDYPPSRRPGPRWGYGAPPHPGLAAVVGAHRDAYGAALDDLAAYAGDLAGIPLVATRDDEPEWRNGWLPGLDAAALYGFLRRRAPATYLEVGSGASTLFAARARRDGALATRIVSVDPRPRRAIDALCDEVVRCGLEQAPRELFARLGAGDVLLFDGSHRTFMGSDATVFFLEVLPALAPGVLVGVHDVYLPDDYPPEIEGWWYSEQYLLAAWLLAAPEGLRPVLAASFASRDPALRPRLDALWTAVGVGGVEPHGVAFWFET